MRRGQRLRVDWLCDPPLPRPPQPSLDPCGRGHSSAQFQGPRLYCSLCKGHPLDWWKPLAWLICKGSPTTAESLGVLRICCTSHAAWGEGDQFLLD